MISVLARARVLRDCEKQKRGHNDCNQGKIYTKKSRIHLRELEDQLLQIPTKLLPQKKEKRKKKLNQSKKELSKID
jgi:hypothetical protein